ncbi:ABC transporter ATP-binding protein [Neomegalonema perideroedes]|uniref:ABC transporter ATP-binding protein n=1 Tax=Neomegalonema perideroedes TaxID=217219 RepID=UPI00037E195C|nr:ATP-binding cassette domain-containing protein [Neomegalonema perideroedes]
MVSEAVSSEAGAFRLEGVGLSVQGREILRGVGLSFPKGRMTALLGHNGSGKSSLLRIMARRAEATRGAVLWDGRAVGAFGERAFARQVAWLPQEMGAAPGMTLRELVACGRYPWHGPLGRFTEEDGRKVAAGIEAVGLGGFEERFVQTLSGGERQRAWIAMMLAQDARCLLLDEPTAALDVAHQVEVLSLLRGLSQEKGLTVVVVMHEVNMAARFCDLIHALKGGEVVASGPAAEIMTPETLRLIYDVEMNVTHPPGREAPIAYVV